MDTKMKMPELVALVSMGEKDTAVVRGMPGKPLTHAQALEVAARCNAAPKLAEALEKVEIEAILLDRLGRDWHENSEAAKCVARILAILKEAGVPQ